jgi:hypothetical protein
MIDYANKDYLKKTAAEKLADAINWLRGRGRYCLEVPLHKRIYTPLNGFPLEPRK